MLVDLLNRARNGFDRLGCLLGPFIECLFPFRRKNRLLNNAANPADMLFEYLAFGFDFFFTSFDEVRYRKADDAERHREHQCDKPLIEVVDLSNLLANRK
jgi:hypothetical protein